MESKGFYFPTDRDVRRWIEAARVGICQLQVAATHYVWRERIPGGGHCLLHGPRSEGGGGRAGAGVAERNLLKRDCQSSFIATLIERYELSSVGKVLDPFLQMA